MGNKLCKKKTELDQTKSPFDRIINRLHLRPNSWKSDTHLNQKQVNRNTKDNTNKTTKIKQLSKSSDWTDAALQVPDGDDEAIHLPNPKLTLIFDNEKGSTTTPIPPPRKHKKGLREKIETVAKNSLQVFQSKKPVDEPLCVKKIIQPTCPTDEHDCAIHNRNHKREQTKNEFNQKQQQQQQQMNIDKTKITKDTKRRKNLSVVSLPNYNELKLTIAKLDDIDKKVDDDDNNSSATSLPNEAKKLTSSCGRLETCMTRCRSFGSLLPQQLLDRWKVRKIPTDNESDDSFGALEDWDLRLIEHYNPKDASLPRPSTRKLQKNDAVLKDVESMIVATNDENSTTLPTPKAPVRKSESLIKAKMNNNEVLQVYNKDKCSKNITATTTTTSSANLKSEENNNDVEHSTLMKILEKYSIEDKQRTITEKNIEMEAENCSFKFRQNLKLIEDFLCNEKMNIDQDLNAINNTNLVKT